MKVYIKPWKEALKCAKEFSKRFVDTVGDINYIIGISHRHGDWGHIVEAKKDNNSKFDYYVTYYKNTESFTYPACCVEEITPEWLEEHGEVFAKDGYKVDTSCELTDWDYNEHFNIIYKVKDTLNTYFFYVRKFYEHGYGCGSPVITDFREIK